MATISRAILAQKVWNRTASDEEIALLKEMSERTVPLPTSPSNRRQRLGLLGAMLQVSRPLPPVLKGFFNHG